MRSGEEWKPSVSFLHVNINLVEFNALFTACMCLSKRIQRLGSDPDNSLTYSVEDKKNHSGDRIKNTEIGRTCSTYGGEERCIQGFGGET